ncbi:STAS domain-containing protein [Jatrophihabitans sp. GAS493]|uniref:STAS domain-containing protein n=1 Tax=Jatrophihabitans sp. GAS493 TaxID=1907575 RepID=UPI000BB7045E|nr:STAS domain-containing protein [Jatrophihabitans sp. GAS493]SOD74532.1 STAS domain-containing protein [Jatrophihabitans sp. GAS493]
MESTLSASDEMSTLRVDALRSEGGRSYIKVSGSMDCGSAELVAALIDVQLSHRRKFIRMDLSDVTVIDVVGVQTVVAAHRRVLADRGTLVLAEVPTVVQAAFHTHAADDGLLVMYPCADHGAAMASFVRRTK